MKIKTLILLYLLSTSILATDKLAGCYKTIQIDGQDIVQGPNPENSESQVYTVHNEYYRDLETEQRLETMIISVFNGYNSPWYGFSNLVLPLSKGQWSITQDVVTFKMDEDLLYINSNYRRSKVDFLVNSSFTFKGNRVIADLYFSSLRRGLFYDFTVVLEKAVCL
ncbi:hypothetical protein [Halobacteriovorax sp. HLS]|uniref:hypothetical protein n=1 Tax=Halobacteriovorax sp. HLS TaxID=2234000 RepID=UPI000FD90375|nr:hypothetical protein [Halobacteriovorax sp. HLS]